MIGNVSSQPNGSKSAIKLMSLCSKVSMSILLVVSCSQFLVRTFARLQITDIYLHLQSYKNILYKLKTKTFYNSHLMIYSAILHIISPTIKTKPSLHHLFPTKIQNITSILLLLSS